MKGDILDFDLQTDSGIISGDDGRRYAFVGAEWKSVDTPRPGLRCDYDIQDGKAVAIYMAIAAPVSVSSSTALKKRPLKYRGWYRSSDEKAVGGVCAGFAHMWNANHTLIQFVFLLSCLLYGAGLLVYIVFWIVLEPLPTKRVKFSPNNQNIQIMDPPILKKYPNDPCKGPTSILTYCPDCKKDVSKNAETCPHCGARLKRSSYGWILLIGVVLLICMGMIWVINAVGDHIKQLTGQ